jgi:hypothetical protein
LVIGTFEVRITSTDVGKLTSVIETNTEQNPFRLAGGNTLSQCYQEARASSADRHLSFFIDKISTADKAFDLTLLNTSYDYDNNVSCWS